MAKPTNDSQVNRAITRLIERVEQRLPEHQLGFYLHGSWASQSNHADSDVDVLAVSTNRVDDRARKSIKESATEIADHFHVPLDFHVHSVADLVDDPYVDLHRGAVFLGGHDARPSMPTPTLDALAREAVSIACQSISYGRDASVNIFDDSGIQIDTKTTPLELPLDHPDPEDRFCGRFRSYSPTGLAKNLTWTATAYVAAKYAYAPTGGIDALRILQRQDDSFAPWIADSITLLREIRRDAMRGDAKDICREILAFENSTISLLLAAIGPKGHLSPRCEQELRTFFLCDQNPQSGDK